MSVQIVPASAELLERTFGKAPEHAMRAIAGVDGETVLGLGGYFEHGPRLVLFANLTPAARKTKRALLRAARQVVKEAKATGRKVVTIADPSVAGVENWLEHLGFRHKAGQLYELE